MARSCQLAQKDQELKGQIDIIKTKDEQLKEKTKETYDLNRQLIEKTVEVSQKNRVIQQLENTSNQQKSRVSYPDHF